MIKCYSSLLAYDIVVTRLFGTMFPRCCVRLCVCYSFLAPRLCSFLCLCCAPSNGGYLQVVRKIVVPRFHRSTKMIFSTSTRERWMGRCLGSVPDSFCRVLDVIGRVPTLVGSWHRLGSRGIGVVGWVLVDLYNCTLNTL